MIIPSLKQLIVKFVVVSGKVCCGAPSVVGKAHWLEDEDFCLARFCKHQRKKRRGWLECFYCARQRCNHRIVLVIERGKQKVGRKTEFPAKVVENRGFDEHILSPPVFAQIPHNSYLFGSKPAFQLGIVWNHQSQNTLRYFDIRLEFRYLQISSNYFRNSI